MSNFRVIYPTDEGGVAVLIPTDECGLTIEEIAAKDVPPIVTRGANGEIGASIPRPYKIVDVSEVPSDRTFRAAWEYSND